MKKTLLFQLAVGALALLLPIFVFAQRDQRVSNVGQNYVISAKAGGVNFIEGNVMIARKEGRSGNLLKGDNVEVGDKVTTGANGKAEILLNPGSYIRLAENSEFEFITTSLDDLKLKLIKGSAMLEVFADDEYSVLVETPNSKFVVIKSGIYRVDVLSDGSSKLEVWEGKARIGATEVKEGRAATVANGQTTVAKFDRDEKDALEVWSKTRAKELAMISERLERRTLRNSLISSYRMNPWSIYNSFGLWIYDASFSGHCFFPFGYGWRSPYGYGFGWSIWDIRLPYYIIYPPVNPNTPGNGNPNETDRARTREIPPYQTIQNDVGRRNPTDSRTPQNNDSYYPSVQPSNPVIILPQTSTGAKSRDN